MNEQARVIFQDNYLGVVATINEDGSPRATPLHIAADDEAVYWLSDENAVHSRNIARDPRVSLTLFSPDLSGGPKGVYISGQAERLEKAGWVNAHDIFKNRLGSVPAKFENWNAYSLSIGTLNEQKSTGSCWYFYT